MTARAHDMKTMSCALGDCYENRRLPCSGPRGYIEARLIIVQCLWGEKWANVCM